MAAAVAALAVSTALLAVLVVGLLRSHGAILRALHDLGVDLDQPRDRTFAAGTRPGDPPAGLPAGRQHARVAQPRTAADVDGLGPDGSTVHIAVRDVEHATLLAFLTTGCELCHGFWQALAHPQERARIGEGVRIVVVTQAAQDEMPSAVARLAPPGVTTVMSPSAWDAYAVPVAPFFVLVDGASGTVAGEGAAPSWQQLVDLLGRVADDAGQPRRPGGSRSWAAREADTDAALRAAGIVPGDPRLHHGGRPLPAERGGDGSGDSNGEDVRERR